MRRYDVILELTRSKIYQQDDAIVVSNIGYCSRELYAISDRPCNFYMLGSMGLASSIGLGLSITHPEKHIFVIDGDASVLMNLGTLATIANSAKDNLHLIIPDNRANSSTGGQPSQTSKRTDLIKVAKGAGIRRVIRIKSQNEFKKILRKSLEAIPTLILVECKEGNETKVGVIPLSQFKIKERFMRFVDGHT